MCISLIIVVRVIASVTEVYRYSCLTDKSNMVDCWMVLTNHNLQSIADHTYSPVQIKK